MTLFAAGRYLHQAMREAGGPTFGSTFGIARLARKCFRSPRGFPPSLLKSRNAAMPKVQIDKRIILRYW